MKNCYQFTAMLLVLWAVLPGCEQQPVREDVFAKAMEQYEEGNYEEAIELFTQAARDSDNPAIFCNRANCYSYLNQFEAAMKDYTTAIKKARDRSDEPNDIRLSYFYYNRGYACQRAGRYKRAVSDYEKTIELDDNYPDVKNNLAWMLATNPDPKVRNPKRAVELATAECKKTKWKNKNCLDTLAAAHASAGDFAKAVKRQKQVIELTRQYKEKRDGLFRLELYLKNEPFIESAKD